jgi:phospholipase/carboxylesterase
VTLEHLVRRPERAVGRPPLVVLLHGLGADETDLFGLAPALDRRFLVVAPRAPREAVPVGFAWYDVDWYRVPPRADEQQAAESQGALVRFLGEVVRAYGVDPARVWLLGFSQGASMAMGVALAQPGLVRGVVAHSGRLVHRFLPAAPPAGLAGFPVLWQHGRGDAVVPVGCGHEARERLPPLGVRLDYREYDIGHEIDDRSLRDLAGWLSARLDEVAPP